jgi:glycosyltransferase involved in cell wall biosynthesis
MSETPLVTVLLPVRNAAPYLREALQSLREQTYRHFRVLAIDDGSTDDSLEILRSFRDERLRVITRSGKGLVTTLSEGLEFCDTPYVARMDADDRALPQRLERQVRALDDDRSLVMLGTRVSVIDAEGKPLASPAVLQEDRAIRRALAVTNCFAHGSVMFRRDEVRQAGGYRASAHLVEDYDLWMRLAERGKLANLPDALYEWRTNPASVSRTGRAAQKAAAESLADAFWERLYPQAGPAPADAWSEIWGQGLDRTIGSDLHLQFARGYLKRGRRSLAFDHVNAALALRPTSIAAWGYLPGMLLPAAWFLAIEDRGRDQMERLRGW